MYDGSSISLIVRVLLNICNEYLVELLLRMFGKLVRNKSTIREGALAHYEQHFTLHTYQHMNTSAVLEQYTCVCVSYLSIGFLEIMEEQ